MKRLKRILKIVGLGFLLALPWIGASAQQVNNYCWVDAGPPVHWAPCNSTNPLSVSGSFTPSGNTAVVGPTADGSPATTPPILIGGTADGTATGTVDVWKVTTAGIGYVNNAPSAASDAGLTPASTAALAANLVVKAGAGNLYSFEVSADSTLSAAAWWVMIYNATSAPVDGAVTPLKCYAMALGVTSYAAAFPVPVAASTGITIGVSTTGCFTKTASTHAFISGDAQ